MNVIDLNSEPMEENIDTLLHDMSTDHHTKTLFRDGIVRELCAILISEKVINDIRLLR